MLPKGWKTKAAQFRQGPSTRDRNAVRADPIDSAGPGHEIGGFKLASLQLGSGGIQDISADQLAEDGLPPGDAQKL